MGVRWVEPLRRDVEDWGDHGKALALQIRGSESDPQNPYKKPGMSGHTCNPSNGKIEGSKARGHLELPAETRFWQSFRPIIGPVSKDIDSHLRNDIKIFLLILTCTCMHVLMSLYTHVATHMNIHPLPCRHIEAVNV